MLIKLNVTEEFNYAIDFTGVSDLRTYIDIGLTDKLSDYLSFTLINFILNLDSNFIDEIKKIDHAFYFMREEGFFIVKKAIFKFNKISGGEAEVYDYMTSEDNKKYYKVWPYTLRDENKIYEIGGTLALFPEMKIFLYLVSDSFISMEFDSDDAIYIDSYSEFVPKVKELNDEIKTLIQNKKISSFFNND